MVTFRRQNGKPFLFPISPFDIPPGGVLPVKTGEHASLAPNSCSPIEIYTAAFPFPPRRTSNHLPLLVDRSVHQSGLPQFFSPHPPPHRPPPPTRPPPHHSVIRNQVRLPQPSVRFLNHLRSPPSLVFGFRHNELVSDRQRGVSFLSPSLRPLAPEFFR